MDPATLSGMGTLLSGASSFGSMVSGLFGGDDGPGFTETYNHSRKLAHAVNKQTARGALEGKLKAAAYYGPKTGIHPLVAIGASTTGGPIAYNGQEKIADDMGQNISRAVNSFVAGQREKQLHEINMERAKLDLEGKKLDNDILRANLTNINKQPGDGPVPLWIDVYDQNTGKIKQFPNPKAVEGVESAGFIAGTAMSTDLAVDNVRAKYVKEVSDLWKRHENRANKGKGTPIMKAWEKSWKDVWEGLMGHGPMPKYTHSRKRR